MTDEHKTVLLYSGGLDSAALFYALGKPAALYVGGMFGPARYASVGETLAIARQREISPEFDRALEIVSVDFRPFMRPRRWDFARETVLALAAWGAEYDEAMYGYVQEDGMNRNHVRKQCKRIADAVGTTEEPFKVSFPAWRLDKTALVKRALDKGATPEFLAASYSCVVDPLEACGKCKGCEGRKRALKAVENAI